MSEKIKKLSRINNAVPQQITNHFVDDQEPGFIHHPDSIPLDIRLIRKQPDETQFINENQNSKLGLSFNTNKQLKPGMHIEISIPLRNDEQKFLGQVVFVRKKDQGYDVGIVLRSQNDAYRARIIEQVCYINCYIQEQQSHSTKLINREQCAYEWISRYAAHFPA